MEPYELETKGYLLPRNSTHYSIAGTRFYRLGSRKLSTFQYKGTNLQNAEKGLRSIYWADKGKNFNQRDQSGAEAKIVAFLTHHGKFRDLFLNSIKPHVYVGLYLFRDIWQEKINTNKLDIRCDINDYINSDIPLLSTLPFWKELNKLIKSSDSWEPKERYYYIAKQVCHSSNYGIEPEMLSLNTLEKSRGKIVLKKEDSYKFLQTYHGLFPEIREWHNELEYQIRETRIIWNLLGDPIQITSSLDLVKHIKECLSAIPQSTVACITRRAFTKMQSFIEDTGVDWDLMQDNHDSILIQCPPEDNETCHKMLREFIEIELVGRDGVKFKMGSEGTTGLNWGPYDEKYNPDGMREVEL